MSIYSLGSDRPNLPATGRYWISEQAVVMGKVNIGLEVTIWPFASVRGDNERITIHYGSNVQENCIMHTDLGFSLHVGANCTIGHGTILHGCSVGSRVIVGMGSIILNGAKVAEDCIIGAGSLITEGKEFLERGKLILGSPAKIVRDLSEIEITNINKTAKSYQEKIPVLIEKLRAV